MVLAARKVHQICVQYNINFSRHPINLKKPPGEKETEGEQGGGFSKIDRVKIDTI